jgi:signal transduction histidine kinase
MVNDLLDVARIEAHQLELAHIPFSVVSETHKVIDMLRSPAGTCGNMFHHNKHTRP